jgi:hypothetical protein
MKKSKSFLIGKNNVVEPSIGDFALIETNANNDIDHVSSSPKIL